MMAGPPCFGCQNSDYPVVILGDEPITLYFCDDCYGRIEFVQVGHFIKVENIDDEPNVLESIVAKYNRDPQLEGPVPPGPRDDNSIHDRLDDEDQLAGYRFHDLTDRDVVNPPADHSPRGESSRQARRGDKGSTNAGGVKTIFETAPITSDDWARRIWNPETDVRWIVPQPKRPTLWQRLKNLLLKLKQ